MRDIQKINFTVGYSDSKKEAPEEYYPAAVPGAVQLDYEKAKGLMPYWYGENYKNYLFAEDKFWHYEADIEIKKTPEKTPFLCFKGIDYKYGIFVNGEEVLCREGVFTPVRLGLQEYAGEKIKVRVVVFPAPKNPRAKSPGGEEACYSCKSMVSYGGDWHPRLIPLGIYDDAFVEYANTSHIKSFDLSSYVPKELDRVKISTETAVENPCGSIFIKVREAGGKEVFSKELTAKGEVKYEFEIENPKLWWCHNQGEQNRYEIYAELYDENGHLLDSAVKKTGFKRIKLLTNEGTYNIPQVFPDTQAEAPASIELNGRRIFAKGSNWVPAEIFPGLITEETYRIRLTLAKDANMNILRLWGGGVVNKDSFYELCDEMGIMVWQEFPLACAVYPDDDEYLKVLDRESRSMLNRFKNYACLTLWCGGNELLTSWGGMTDQSHPLRLLDKNCYELDRHKPYLFTSPRFGMGHGHYVLLTKDNRETLPDYIKAAKTAYSEFGVSAPAPVDYLKTFIPPEEFDDFANKGSWKAHHAFMAWAFEDTWFRTNDIKYFYGEAKSFEELTDNGRELQKEGYKHIFEEARRQWPHCAMALNWCFNEPWPCAANNSLLSWPAIKKEGYYGVQQALRDQMVSLRVEKLGWKNDETLNVQVFILNDLPSELKGGKVTVGIRFHDGKETDLKSFEYDTVSGLSGVCTGAVTCPLKNFSGKHFTLYAKADNCKLNSEYKLYILL